MEKKQANFFLLIIFLLNAVLLNAQDTAGKAISEIVFAQKMQKRKTIVIDVRTPDEYKQGHIKNAINYNVLDSLSFDNQIITLKKNKKYLLYCRSGVRSGKALMRMEQKGFKHLFHLAGGISAWTGEIEKPNVQ